jgi:hypothetical protein
MAAVVDRAGDVFQPAGIQHAGGVVVVPGKTCVTREPTKEEVDND